MIGLVQRYETFGVSGGLKDPGGIVNADRLRQVAVTVAVGIAAVVATGAMVAFGVLNRRMPSWVPERAERMTELIRLRREMRECVEQEDYEGASRLRDQIRQLEEEQS